MLLINDKLQEFDLEAAFPLLSAQRQEKLMQYKSHKERCASAAVYLLLCEALRTKYAINEPPTFEYNEKGKPFIVGHREIHFNMSHCDCAAICVLSDAPIGVDIETTDRYSRRLAQYTMNSGELRQIDSAQNAAIEFARLWTMKEALLKMRGCGITNNMKEVLTECNALFETTISADERYVYTVCRP